MKKINKKIENERKAAIRGTIFITAFILATNISISAPYFLQKIEFEKLNNEDDSPSTTKANTSSINTNNTSDKEDISFITEIPKNIKAIVYQEDKSNFIDKYIEYKKVNNKYFIFETSSEYIQDDNNVNNELYDNETKDKNIFDKIEILNEIKNHIK